MPTITSGGVNRKIGSFRSIAYLTNLNKLMKFNQVVITLATADANSRLSGSLGITLPATWKEGVKNVHVVLVGRNDTGYTVAIDSATGLLNLYSAGSRFAITPLGAALNGKTIEIMVIGTA